MRSIAFVVPELLPVPPVQGGAVEHWVDEVARRMVAPGRTLAMVSRPAGTAGDAGIDYRAIPWTRSERWFQRLKDKVSWRNPLRYVAKLQNVWSYGRRAAQAVRESDLVYLHNEPNILLFLRKRAQQRIVLHMHNDHLSGRLFRPLYRRLLRKADRVIFISDHVRQQALRHFPEHAARFCVMHNATDPQLFRPYDEARAQLPLLVWQPDLRYLLYVGRLVPDKGVHVLIAAFALIRQRRPDVRLIVAGSSFFGGAARTPYERELEALAAPLSEAMVFTGYLPHGQLKYLYAAADVVAFPSVWQEPFGLVMLEAMASGTSLVASRVGGIPEVVSDGVDGVLVPPGDAAALADAVCALLADAHAKTAMEQKGREKIVQAYTWDRLVGQIASEFEAMP